MQELQAGSWPTAGGSGHVASVQSNDRRLLRVTQSRKTLLLTPQAFSVGGLLLWRKALKSPAQDRSVLAFVRWVKMATAARVSWSQGLAAYLGGELELGCSCQSCSVLLGSSAACTKACTKNATAAHGCLELQVSTGSRNSPYPTGIELPAGSSSGAAEADVGRACKAMVS